VGRGGPCIARCVRGPAGAQGVRARGGHRPPGRTAPGTLGLLRRLGPARRRLRVQGRGAVVQQRRRGFQMGQTRSPSDHRASAARRERGSCRGGHGAGSRGMPGGSGQRRRRWLRVRLWARDNGPDVGFEVVTANPVKGGDAARTDVPEALEGICASGEPWLAVVSDPGGPVTEDTEAGSTGGPTQVRPFTPGEGLGPGSLGDETGVRAHVCAENGALLLRPGSVTAIGTVDDVKLDPPSEKMSPLGLYGSPQGGGIYSYYDDAANRSVINVVWTSGSERARRRTRRTGSPYECSQRPGPTAPSRSSASSPTARRRPAGEASTASSVSRSQRDGARPTGRGRPLLASRPSIPRGQ